MKVYIAGPMSGIPAFNIPAFDSAAAFLREKGHEVVSPAEVDGPVTRAELLMSHDGDHRDLPPGESWSFYLARDFQILADQGIEAIVTLPGWETSKGAQCEVAVGKVLGIPRFDYNELMPDGLHPIKVFGPRLDAISVNDDGTVNEPFQMYEDNPLRQRTVHGGVKDNRGKSRVDLLPTKPLVAAGEVMEYGARKYKPHNWRLGLNWSDTMASAMRHLLAFNDGEDLDPETGKPHLAHALCQVLFLAEYYMTGTGTDDRFIHIDRDEAKA